METKPPELSSRALRRRAAALTGVGFLLSLMMAAYQLHLIQRPWEPFFGYGTEEVLHSAISRALPVPDAVLGALVYLLDLVLLLWGDEDRWWRRPILALASGLVSCGLTAVAVLLVWTQGVFVHAWCTPCLISAAMLLVSLHLTLAEPLSSARLVFYSALEGHPWREVTLRGLPEEDPLVSRSALPHRPDWHWNLPICAGAGVFLLVFPAFFSADLNQAAVFSIRLAAVFAIAGSVLAACPAARPLRLLNGAAGFILLSWYAGVCAGPDRYVAAGIGFGLICLSFFGLSKPLSPSGETPPSPTP